MSLRVGVMGGTFDPIHIGHLAAAEDAVRALLLDSVLFVPNSQPPHKPAGEVSPASARLAMTELAVADNEKFAVSTIELERPGPSYTIDTMRELRLEFGASAKLFFLVGRDVLNYLHTWHEPQRLLDEFDVAILDRALERGIDWTEAETHFPAIRDEVTVIPVPRLDVSSKEIRQRARLGQSIRYLVPPSVHRYIAQRGLYGFAASE
ncbi:MAG TPA: nicotinate-nucleotide adenylyltransferase [Chloroflexota bacterium]|nr:nicotinate-nucleotide adenylyltransferase [Chloroflexota bacterium]